MMNCDAKQEKCTLNVAETTISELTAEVFGNVDAILNIVETIDDKLFGAKPRQSEQGNCQPDGIEDGLKLIIDKCNVIGNILSNVNSRL